MGHTAPAGAESPARYCLSPALFPYGEASARVSPGPAGGGGGRCRQHPAGRELLSRPRPRLLTHPGAATGSTAESREDRGICCAPAHSPALALEPR